MDGEAAVVAFIYAVIYGYSHVHKEEDMKLSVIMPCYNEAGSLPAMLAALEQVFDDIPGEKEILAIDDGSPDDTYQVLCALKLQYKYLHIIRFARNFGKEAALTCGLRMAKGDAVVMLDSDLQHPPFIILDMLEKWRQGDKMVYALRRNRNVDGFVRKFLTNSFYFLFKHITDLDLPRGAGDFRLLDRKVVDAVNQLPEKNRFMKGLMTWVGFQSGFVWFEVAERADGQSSFSFKRLFKLAVDAITAFSNIPLRIWSFIGVLVSAGAFLYSVYLIIDTLVFGVKTPGFVTIMCVILFLGGIQLISLGVIGEYIGRVFTEVKGRPIYIVAEDLPPEKESIMLKPPPASLFRS
jgi:glycosyltransferase involved in cell wall biosynthesis